MRVAQGSLLWCTSTSVLLCSPLCLFFLSALFFSCRFCLCPHKPLKLPAMVFQATSLSPLVSLCFYFRQQGQGMLKAKKCVITLTTESCGILERDAWWFFGSMWQLLIHISRATSAQSVRTCWADNTYNAPKMLPRCSCEPDFFESGTLGSCNPRNSFSCDAPKWIPWHDGSFSRAAVTRNLMNLCQQACAMLYPYQADAGISITRFSARSSFCCSATRSVSVSSAT